MKLICVSCGGFTYFDVEVEAFKTIEIDNEGIVIEDDDWILRANLDDMVNYVPKEPNETVTDAGNKYITCARCGSRNVVVPYVKWNPPLDIVSINDELLENRTEYLHLRKERHCENIMPFGVGFLYFY